MKTSLSFSAAGLVLAAAAACTSPSTATIPKTLEAAPDEMPTMTVRARGVQIYQCRAKAEGAEWAFVAPEAELFDVRGRPMGSHGAGPVWEALDGSAIRASVKARADAPVAGAIPWLLLVSKPAGKQGSFSHVTSIQRVNTTGGIAPADGCDKGAIGKGARIPYTADYVFYSKRDQPAGQARG